MPEQPQPQPPMTVWGWAIDVPIDPDVPNLYELHDQSRWPHPDPLALARMLACQFDTQGAAYWRIRIWNTADPAKYEVVIYTSADHDAWLTLSGAPEERMRLLEEKDEIESDYICLEPGHSDHMHFPADRPIDFVPTGADASPAEVGWHPGLAHSLRHFEGMLGPDGTPDQGKLLIEAGELLVDVVTSALDHAIHGHPGESWTVCPDRARLVAKVAATYVSAYLATVVK